MCTCIWNCLNQFNYSIVPEKMIIENMGRLFIKKNFHLSVYIFSKPDSIGVFL